MDDDQIRAVVQGLSRPQRSGGAVIERAAILAAGGDFRAILAWIEDHDGVAEAVVTPAPKGGLHGSRMGYGVPAEAAAPSRFILPPGALGLRP
jgi:hypothetical protein